MKNEHLTLISSLVTLNRDSQQTPRLSAVYEYAIPLSQPLQLAHGLLQQRQGLLLKFISEQGVSWGEAAPLPGFSPESLSQVKSALKRWLTGSKSYEMLPTSLQFALSMGQHPLASTAPVASAQLLTQNQPITHLSLQPLKLKVGLDIAADADKINQLIANYPQLRLRLDANRQWTLAQALAFQAKLGALPQLEFIEEPCQTDQQSMLFAQQSGWPIALDETLQQRGYQPTLVTGLAALVCKPSLIGSVERCLQLHHFCTQHNLKFIISGSFESNLTHRYLNALAHQLQPEATHGLDTLARLGTDLITPRDPSSTRPVIPETELEQVWQA